MENLNENTQTNDENSEFDVFLTTVDNIFDPSKQFDEWKRFDEDHGYYTCSYLARIVNLKPSMTEEEESKEIERAIDEIISINNVDEVIYKKVKVPKKDDVYIPLTDDFIIKDDNEKIII